MDVKQIHQIFLDTAYSRVGGSQEEAKCAEYLLSLCAQMGLTARMEEFEVHVSAIKKEILQVDGKEIPCKGYLCAGSSEVEAPFYYLPNDDACSLAGCRGKIVLFDGSLTYWKYQDLLENGAVGFITYDGNVNYTDQDIDRRELRPHVSNGKKIPGVNINARTAVELVRSGAKTAKIVLDQEENGGTSHNVILDLPGQVPETIVITAHYDSTHLSQGAYDNMSGCVGLLALAEKFSRQPHRYSLRFIWCGSEERGLLGSKAYAAAHMEELDRIIFNVNLDMIGCAMGKFIACCTTEEKLVHYVEYLASIEGMDMSARQDVYSSDSTSFADQGIPAMSFARIAPRNIATIHNRYDTMEVMQYGQLLDDIHFIGIFLENMADAKRCPVAREIPENMKERLEIHLSRKREKR